MESKNYNTEQTRKITKPKVLYRPEDEQRRQIEQTIGLSLNPVNNTVNTTAASGSSSAEPSAQSAPATNLLETNTLGGQANSEGQKEESAWAARRRERAESVQNAFNNFVETEGRYPTDAELEALAGDNMYAYQKHYGIGHGSNLGTVLGSGYLYGRVNPYTRRNFEEQYKGWKNAQEEAAKAQTAPETANQTGAQSVTSTANRAGITPEQLTAANKLVSYIREHASDVPKDMTEGERTRLQELIKEVGGKDVKIDGKIGWQTTGEMLNAILGTVSNRDTLQDTLEKAGVNEDGTITPQKQYELIDIMREREAEKMRNELRTQQRELERRANRASFGEFAAILGDMAKASGGAPVTPRETIRQIYNQLDERNQNNYRNYLARLEKAKADAKAEKQRLANQAFQREMAEQQHKWQESAGEEERKFRASESEAERTFRERENAADRTLRENIALERLNADKEIAKNKLLFDIMKNNIEKAGDSPLIIGDKKYSFPKEDNKTIKAQMYAKIMQNRPELNENPEIASINAFYSGSSDDYSKMSAIVDYAIGAELVDENTLKELISYAEEHKIGNALTDNEEQKDNKSGKGPTSSLPGYGE